MQDCPSGKRLNKEPKHRFLTPEGGEFGALQALVRLLARQAALEYFRLEEASLAAPGSGPAAPLRRDPEAHPPKSSRKPRP